MTQSRHGSARRASLLQITLMAGAYLGAASLVSWSAYAAKQSHLSPALVAMDANAAAGPTQQEQEPLKLGQVPGEVEVVDLEDAEPVADAVEVVSSEIRYFNGRAVRPAKTYWMTVTGYSPDERSCGKWADGITASNKSVWTNAMRLVAADTRILPFGSLLTVEGYADDQIVPVEDRGGAIKGMRLDLLYPTHEEALQWGVQRLPVTVWEYVED